MTVADNTSRNQYTATSGQTVFAYTFEIVDKGHIVVLQDGTTLSEGTDYTVSDVGNNSGGNVTLTTGATAGDILTLYRDMPYSRTQNYTNSGDFLASEVNSDFDNLWLAGEQTERSFSQSVRKPITDADSISMELPEAATRANKYLKFTTTGAVTTTAFEESWVLRGTGDSIDQTNAIQALIDAADPYSVIHLIGKFAYTALTINVEGLRVIIDGVLKQYSSTASDSTGFISITADYVSIEGGQFDGNTTTGSIISIDDGADYVTIKHALFTNLDVDDNLTSSSGNYAAIVISGDFARIDNCTFKNLTNSQTPGNSGKNDSFPRGMTVLGNDCTSSDCVFQTVANPHTVTGDRFQSFDAYMKDISDNGYYMLCSDAVVQNASIIDCTDEPFVFGAPAENIRVIGGYIKNHGNAISFDRATDINIDGLSVNSTACAHLFKTRSTNTTHGQTITAITQASEAVVTETDHGLAVGAEVTITGATPSGYNGTYNVTAKTDDTITIDLDSSSLGAYTASSGTLTSEGQGCRNIRIRNVTAKVSCLFQVTDFTTGTVRDFLLENSNIQHEYNTNSRSVRVKNITQASNAEVETPSVNNITVGMTVTIAGATPSGYNGEYTVQTVVNTKKFTIDLDSSSLAEFVEASNYDSTVTADLPYGAGYLSSDTDGHFLESTDIRDFIIRSNTFNITDGDTANATTEYKISPVSTASDPLKIFSNNQIITESASGDARMSVTYADFDSPFLYVQPSTGVVRDHENTRPMFWSTAAPSAGTFVDGTIIFNSSASAGGTIGWVRISGAWKTFGDIAS